MKKLKKWQTVEPFTPDFLLKRALQKHQKKIFPKYLHSLKKNIYFCTPFKGKLSDGVTVAQEILVLSV